MAQVTAFSTSAGRRPVITRRGRVTAERHGLGVYDAAHLEPAPRRDLPLATLDDALRKAAMQAGVAALPVESGHSGAAFGSERSTAAACCLQSGFTRPGVHALPRSAPGIGR